MKLRINKALALILVTLAISITAVNACEIKFDIEKGKKDKYALNDEIVVNVKITLTHRNCSVAMKNTKFQLDGMKVVGQKEWTETSPGVWERKLKIQVLGNATGKPKMTVVRTCDKEGGLGVFEISSAILK